MKADPQTVLLINEISLRRAIWDDTFPDHFISQKRQNAWDNLSSRMALPVEVCKILWRNVQRGRNQNHRRALKTPSKPHSPYAYEKEMAFLPLTSQEERENCNIQVGTKEKSPRSPLKVISINASPSPQVSSTASMEEISNVKSEVCDVLGSQSPPATEVLLNTNGSVSISPPLPPKRKLSPSGKYETPKPKYKPDQRLVLDAKLKAWQSKEAKENLQPDEIIEELVGPEEEEGDFFGLMCLSMAARMRKLHPKKASRLKLHCMMHLNTNQVHQSFGSMEPERSEVESASEADEIEKHGKDSIFPTAPKGFPNFTKEMNNVIDHFLGVDDLTLVVSAFGLTIKGVDIKTLRPGKWLNDQIINMYLILLEERGKDANLPSVKAFNTFFYPKLLNEGYTSVKEWAAEVDLFSYDFILVPIHRGKHWCMATIDIKQKKINYYDSFGGEDPACLKKLKKYLKRKCYDKEQESTQKEKEIEKEISEGQGETISSIHWNTDNLNAQTIPKQLNSYDCGLFSLMFADYESRREPFNFKQEDFGYFRRKVVYEIVNVKLTN